MSWLSEMTGSDARKKANKVGEKQEGMIAEQAALVKRFQEPALADMWKSIQAIDPSSADWLGPRRRSGIEAMDRNADSAIDNLRNDFAESGFTSSSGMNAAASGIREQQAIQGGNYDRDLMNQGEQEKFQRMQSFASPIMAMGQNTVGQLGGLQGMYQSQAADAMNSFIGAGTAIAGMAGGRPPMPSAAGGSRGASAGDAILNGNQRPSPMPAMPTYGNTIGAQITARSNPTNFFRNTGAPALQGYAPASSPVPQSFLSGMPDPYQKRRAVAAERFGW